MTDKNNDITEQTPDKYNPDNRDRVCAAIRKRADELTMVQEWYVRTEVQKVLAGNTATDATKSVMTELRKVTDKFVESASQEIPTFLNNCRGIALNLDCRRKSMVFDQMLAIARALRRYVAADVESSVNKCIMTVLSTWNIDMFELICRDIAKIYGVEWEEEC